MPGMRLCRCMRCADRGRTSAAEIIWRGVAPPPHAAPLPPGMGPRRQPTELELGARLALRLHVAARAAPEQADDGPSAGAQRRALQGDSLVRLLREHAGLTTQQMADKLGITWQSVWRLEQRGMNVKLATVMGIAKKLGVPIRWAFGPVRKEVNGG